MKQFVGQNVTGLLEVPGSSFSGRYLNSIAIVQEFKITPVQNLSDIIQFGKEAMAKAK